MNKDALAEQFGTMLRTLVGDKEAGISGLPGVADDVKDLIMAEARVKADEFTNALATARAIPTEESLKELNSAHRELQEAIGEASSLTVKMSTKSRNVKPKDKTEMGNLMLALESALDAQQMLDDHGDIGGPIAGRLAPFVELSTIFDAMLADSVSFVANLKGGKNITETEIRIFGGLIPFLADTFNKKRAGLNQMALWLTGKIAVIQVATGMTDEDVELIRDAIKATRTGNRRISPSETRESLPIPEGSVVVGELP